MSAASARQSQRVPIDAPVRLTLRAPDSSSDAERTLPGRALDLSEGGMRVATDTTLAVGEEVTCSLELDDVRASLRGRVRWSKPVAAALSLGRIGLGIEWSALDDAESGLLRRWLASNHQRGELVLLHLTSLLEPLRARGYVTGDALQLVAALPQLAPGVEVEFQLGDYGSRRVGRIERVELQKRTTGAAPELALQLLPSGSARSRRQLVYGLAESEIQPALPPPDLRGASFAAAAPQLGSGARERLDSLEDTRRMRRRSSSGATLARRSGTERAKWRDLVRGALRRGGHEDTRPRRATLQDPRMRQHTTEEFQAPRARVETLTIPTLSSARLMRSAIWLLGGISIAVLIWALRDAARDQRPSDGGAARPEPGVAKLAAKPDAPAPVEAPVAPGQLPVAAGERPAAAAAREDVAAAVDDSTHGSPSQPSAVAPPAAPVAARPKPTAMEPLGAAAHPARASVSTVGRRSEIFLPLVGSLKDLRVTLWREPPALIIDMPAARVASPASIRSLRGGGIRRVRLDEARSTPQLQLFLSSASARFVTRNVANGLVIVLEYDLRAMP